MTDQQKAELDLAVLNLKNHGDDQLLTAIKPLLEFYESHRAAGASERDAAVASDPVAWMVAGELREEHGFYDDQRAIDRGAVPLFTGDQMLKFAADQVRNAIATQKESNK